MNDSAELKKIIVESEPEANIIVSNLLSFLAIIYGIFWILFKFNIYTTNASISELLLIGSSIVLGIISLICSKLKGKGSWMKWILILILLSTILQINILSGNKAILLYAIPVVLSCRYYQTKFTVFTGLIASISIILGSVLDVILAPVLGIIDLNIVTFSSPVTIHVTQSLYRAIIGQGIETELVLKNAFRLSTFTNIVIILVLTKACIELIKKGQKLIVEQVKEQQEKAKLEIELNNSKTRIMISQIQPHFLYNALSAIMAIDGNPDETIDALADFSKYLRENLNTLTSSDLASFTKEMEHVKRYVSLEQLRFGDHVNVIYDLKSHSFQIPTLTVQMLVENAIKHGITKKANGGTVRVSSMETEDEFVVTIEDDGLGFDPSSIPEKEDHVGLKNLQYRLQTLCGGYLETISEIGNGTMQIVHIPKKGNQS